MFAYVCAATGWTWDYIGEHMTLPRLYAMNEHWAKYPPVHVSAALFAGTGKKPHADQAREQAKLETWIADMPTMNAPRAGAAERARARQARTLQ